MTACLLGCAMHHQVSVANVNCLGDLNLIYCLIYLDDIVVFLLTVEEHFHWLCMIFGQFREHNLELRPSKFNCCREGITYLAYWVSKDGVQPSNSNLKTIAECALPQTYTEVCAFLGLVGHYRKFINGFTCIAQPLSEYLARKGANRMLEQLLLSEVALKAFEALKQVCMMAPILGFADYTKPFLLETDASKEGLETVLSQKQTDGWYHLVTYGSRAFIPPKKNYHLPKLKFTALKWAVTEHFKECLLYQPFLMKTGNNSLAYIMTTPNIDALGHW